MAWTVPFVGYIQQYQDQKRAILDTIEDVLSHGDLMLRQQLRDFEAHLAEFCGTKHAVGTGNCTDALILAVRAANLGPGDEVITVSHTFVATAAAIHHNGATPVLVDIGDDHNMDPAAFEAAITPRTKAVMPVHLNGRSCDMRRIMAIAEAHDLIVIEDAAQALGATYEGKQPGAFGLAGCFSFYPAKLLGAFGDGGALITDDNAVATRVRGLRDHGRTPEGDLGEWAFNSRLDNLQAALLDNRLQELPVWEQRRRAIAAQYHEGLSGLDEVQLPPPPVDEGPYYDVYQNYEVEAEDRDGLREHLVREGVETLLPWGGRGVHQFANLGLQGFNLPRTERFFEGALLLPMFPELTDDQVEHAVRAVRSYYVG